MNYNDHVSFDRIYQEAKNKEIGAISGETQEDCPSVPPVFPSLRDDDTAWEEAGHMAGLAAVGLYVKRQTEGQEADRLRYAVGLWKQLAALSDALASALDKMVAVSEEHRQIKDNALMRWLKEKRNN